MRLHTGYTSSLYFCSTLQVGCWIVPHLNSPSSSFISYRWDGLKSSLSALNSEEEIVPIEEKYRLECLK